MPTTHYAHTFGPNERDWEPLEAHLNAVAKQAETFAAKFNAPAWGHLAGLWHDVGKYSEAFQNYLRISTVKGEEGDSHRAETAGRVDHSTAGAQHAVSLGPLGRVLAYCIAGHHAGLPDNEGSDSGLSARLKKKVECYNSAPHDLLTHPLPTPPVLKTGGDRRRGAFAISFFTRMLFSCLVDADFLATEQFMDRERSSQRPDRIPSAADFLIRLDAFLNEKARTAADTAVNRRRQEVLAACRDKAKLPPGLFSLNVPTGGGKTLSSLAFALTHAAEHGLDRVIYAIPFTSIIEQTADVFREALDDLKEHVLEHHSNLDPNDPKKQSVRSRLASENWDSSLVVTTNVQLFESLFASRTSRSRKLHRLARSVIILDEAQTLAPNLLAPTLAVLEELVRNYGATVVLCTATQPAIERREGFAIGLEGVTPIIGEPQSLHDALRRTNVEPAGLLSNDEVVQRFRKERQALCIVNSRRHASELFKSLDDPDSLHLSASMCAAHRSKVVGEIRRRLDPQTDEPCRVISTQVIEAGVDVDFPTVFRAAAGLDSVAQAAGRCNREGRLKDDDGNSRLGNVVVFDFDEQTHRPPPFVRRAAGHFREVAPDHLNDLLAPSAIEHYFKLHYWQQGGEGGSGWDEGRGKESIMQCFDWDGKTGLHAQYRQAADRYQLIDDAQTPVLVPYGKKGQKLVRQLELMPESIDPAVLRGFDRAAQRYVVGVREHALKELLERGVLIERLERYYLANDAAYDRKLGLTFDAIGLDPERLVW